MSTSVVRRGHYRSHFVAASSIAAAGGPVAYMDVWLESESQALDWHSREQAAWQLSFL